MLSYEMNFDADQCILRITLSGHCLIDDIEAYDKAQRDELSRLATLGFGPSKTSLLIDARKQGPQTQDVIAAMNTMRQAPIYKTRRTAVLLSSALMVMQARRVDPQAKVFAEESEAIAWLSRLGSPDISTGV